MGAMKSTIQLVNKYSAEADKISRSANELSKSMQKAVKPTDNLKRSLNNLTNRTHKIKINQVGDKKIQKDLKKLNTEVRKFSNKKYNLQIDYKQGRVEKVKEVMSSFKDKIINIKTNTTGMLKARIDAKKLEKELKKATGKKHRIRINDEGGKGLLNRLKNINKELGKAAKNGLGKLGKGMAIGGAAALGTGVVLGKKALDAGMNLETQQLSMSHFLNGDESASKNYLKGLRKEATFTPFDTDEVVAAGTQAIQVTLGDTERAMSLVKTAEDMAAMTPGATLDEAMNALRSADVGRMEGLKRFGFQGTKEDLDAAGGDILKMKSSKGKTLNDMYGGGAEKLSKSGAGKVSTIGGQLKTGFTDVGKELLDRVSPALDKILPLSEKVMEQMPIKFGEVMDKLSVLVEPVKEIFSSVFEAVQPMIEPLKNLGSALLPLFSTALNFVSSIVKNIVAPAFEVIGSFINSIVVPALEVLNTAIQTFVIPALDLLGSILKATVVPVFQAVAKVVGKVANVFKSVATAVQNFKNKLASFNPFRRKNNDEENATGTSYFGGGITKLNERGEEFMRLPQGTKIYPHGETKRAIKNESRKLFNRTRNVDKEESVSNETLQSGNNRTVILKPVFNITESRDGRDTSREVEKKLRRLAVNI